MFQRIVCWLLITALVVSGCSMTPKSPSFSLHQRLQSEKTVFLVSTVPGVDISPDLKARGVTMGALKGAGEGLLWGLIAAGKGGCSGSYCGAALMVVLALSVAIGVPVGAIFGATQATSEDEAQKMEQTIRLALSQFAPHQDLADKLVVAAGTEGIPNLAVIQLPTANPNTQDFQKLSNQGYRNAVNITLNEIQFSAPGNDQNQLGLHLHSQVQVNELPTGNVALVREFDYLSSTRPFEEWVAGNGGNLRAALSEGLNTLSKQIVNGIFVSSDLPVASHYWAFPGSPNYGCCWICPQYPKYDYGFWRTQQQYPLLKSVQPTLSWDVTPTQEDQDNIERQQGVPITSVRYGIRIWEAPDSKPGNLVYAKDEIPTNSHTIDLSLKPATQYFWSIRSCFTIKGTTSCTPWAFSSLPNLYCGVDQIRSTNYYRFITP